MDYENNILPMQRVTPSMPYRVDLMALACSKYYIQVSGIEDKYFPLTRQKSFFDGSVPMRKKKFQTAVL